MRISTRNGTKGRRLVRAERPLGPRSFGYHRESDGQRALTVQLEGQDGKQYTVMLTDADIDALRIARHEVYAKEFLE